MMGLKIIEIVDNDGNKLFLNPASVFSISEQENWDRSEGQPEKVVNINCYGTFFTVNAPILEIKKLIFG